MSGKTNISHYCPVGKIAEKGVCRSVFLVFLTIWHCIFSAKLTKIPSFRPFFWRFFPLGGDQSMDDGGRRPINDNQKKNDINTREAPTIWSKVALSAYLLHAFFYKNEKKFEQAQLFLVFNWYSASIILTIFLIMCNFEFINGLLI